MHFLYVAFKLKISVLHQVQYLGMMKGILLLMAFLFAFTPLISQSSTERVNAAIQDFRSADDPQDALSFLKNVGTYVKDIPDSVRADYYLSIGIAFGQMGNVDSSFHYLDQAEEIALAQQIEFIILKVYNSRGLVFMGSGAYEKALKAFQKARSLAEGNNSKRYLSALSDNYGNSGGVFYQLGQLDKALDVSKKALVISEHLDDSSGLAYNHLRLAITYSDLDSLNQGVFHLTEASNRLANLGDTVTLLYAENTLGRVFEKKSEYLSALKHYENASSLAKSIGNLQETAFTQLSLAAIHLKLGNVSISMQAANEALQFSLVNNFPNSAKRAYHLLYLGAKRNGSYQEALQFRNKEILLADSISGIEVKEKVMELEANYENAQKEAEIERLSLENELQNANLARSRYALLTIGIAAGMTILVLIILFIQRNKKLSAEKEAQELQIDALKKRFMELHASPSDLAVQLKFNELNNKLNTQLTEREFDALKLSLEGKTNPEIAEKLYISVSTVKFHLRNTYAKMGVGNRKEAFQLMLKTS
ncbi:MAG: LuxR C-terminal-related transcriptional regulator [Bacteroidota bacterium]